MTKSEWVNQVCMEVNARWPNTQWEQPTIAIGYADCGHLDVAAVLTVIRDYAREGNQFPPTTGQIVALAQPPYEPFGEMWPTLQWAMGQIRPMEPVGATLRRVENACGPLVAGWLEQFGVQNMMNAAVDDPTHGGAVRHRIRQDYDAAMGDPASRRRLEAMAPSARQNRVSTTRRGELNRFDPDQHLPTRGDDDDDGSTAV
jgi:hypothetical protein